MHPFKDNNWWCCLPGRVTSVYFKCQKINIWAKLKIIWRSVLFVDCNKFKFIGSLAHQKLRYLLFCWENSPGFYKYRATVSDESVFNKDFKEFFLNF